MSKDAAMTFRIEPELRDEFHAAAASENRPAAQVVRELMRGYIREIDLKYPDSQHKGRRVVDLSRAERASLIAQAGREAVAGLLEKGIPVTGQEGNQIVRQHPDGSKEVLKELEVGQDQ